MPLTARSSARRTWLLVLVLALGSTVQAVPTVLSPAGAAIDRGDPLAWVAPSTTRVPRAGGAVGNRATARIEAARGETESFQVVVRARGGSLSGVRVAVSPLRSAVGGQVAGRDVTLFREHYVPVRRHSPAWSGQPVRWSSFPDALVPFLDPETGRPPRPAASRVGAPRVPASPFAVAGGRNQPVWVDVAVPRSAPPGTYTGTWTVTSRQGSRSGLVSLLVRDFALPVLPASDSRFGVWAPANRRPAVTRLLSRYRVEPAPGPPATGGTGRLHGPASVDLGFWSGADIETCTMSAPPSVEAVRAAALRQPSGLRRYAYTADEVSKCPGLTDRLAAYGRSLHAAGVEHLVTVRPREDLLDDGTGRPVVDIWVLTPWQLRALDPAMRARVEAAGGDLWSYQALVQGRRTPSWQLDFPVTHYRVLGGFLNASQGVTGLLYWAVDRWQQDPWRDPTYTHTTSCCYPGDGLLIYPGRPAGVVGAVPSVRLAMVRDGMDDYDYVTLLRDRGLAAEAARVIARAASSWSVWTADGQVLASVRRELAELIEASTPSALRSGKLPSPLA